MKKISSWFANWLISAKSTVTLRKGTMGSNENAFKEAVDDLSEQIFEMAAK